jgi:hypothetical protein
MPNRTKSPKKPDINLNVSEYVWDINTKRYKRNPDYRPDRIAARLILWGVIVLTMLIAIVWCLRRA